MSALNLLALHSLYNVEDFIQHDKQWPVALENRTQLEAQRQPAEKEGHRVYEGGHSILSRMSRVNGVALPKHSNEFGGDQPVIKGCFQDMAAQLQTNIHDANINPKIYTSV